ncbi:MAG: hypothetical protein ABS942_10990 [Solibacillus sp.]
MTQHINIPVSRLGLEKAVHKLNEVVEGKHVKGIFFNATSLAKGVIEVLIDEPQTEIEIRRVVASVAQHTKTSKYIGVYLPKGSKRWRWQIRVNGQVENGRCDTEIEAARAYDAASLRLRGKGAILNFPLEVAK